MTTTATPTCTVGPAATTGRRCGAAAVITGTFASGFAWGCCADCATPADYAAAAGRRGDGSNIGDHVTVCRYGIAYDAVVTRVGARGAVYATFTYGNGATRTVRV